LPLYAIIAAIFSYYFRHIAIFDWLSTAATFYFRLFAISAFIDAIIFIIFTPHYAFLSITSH